MRFDTDMSYLADKLTVTYSTTTGRTTSITAHNQADSSTLVSEVSELPLLSDSASASDTVELADPDQEAISVRLWNIGDLNGERLRAGFAESLIGDGQSDVQSDGHHWPAWSQTGRMISPPWPTPDRARTIACTRRLSDARYRGVQPSSRIPAA